MKSPFRIVLARSVSFFFCFTLLNISVPMSAVLAIGMPVKESLANRAKAAQQDRMAMAARRAASATRILTDEEQRKLQGAAGENPYLAGQNKWDSVYKGLNLVSGNYSASATDLSFDGGYGIPVNVTRSYSANDGDEGPFGKGWTLSADVRSTAGGLLKSKNAAIRAVPISFKERPSLQLDDPNAEMGNGVATQPAAAVVATDAGGKEETIQRDADGVLTTPPWDKDVCSPTYEYQTLNGNTYQVQLTNQTATPDGTIYNYAKRGAYSNGTVPYNNSGATPEPANVLKIVSAIDRHGNQTVYNYDTAHSVTFQKANGAVWENPLISVQMPNGHIITLTWGNGTAGHPVNRVVSVADNGGRTVLYTYDANGMLQTVTSAGGKTTTYGYGSAVMPSGWSGNVAGNLLTSVRDPRGLTTTLTYLMVYQEVQPYGYMMPAPMCCRMKQPNGMTLYFTSAVNGLTDGDWPSDMGDGTIGVTQKWEEWVGPADTGTLVNWGSFLVERGTSAPTFCIRMYQSYGIGNLITYQEPNYPTYSRKTYDIPSQNLLSEYSYIDPACSSDLSVPRKMQSSGSTRADSVTTYNFMGNPLSKTAYEYYVVSNALSLSRQSSVAYAYWGKEKYYQQKAVRTGESSSNYRYSMTDYYANTDSNLGNRGQTLYVYDPKNSTFVLNTSVSTPTGTPSGSVWKYQLQVVDPTTYSASFKYDSKARPTDVLKLQKTSPMTYVLTRTSYGADTDGSWGQASSVIEDAYDATIPNLVAGPHASRTTMTLQYTSWGKASEVQDAAGNVFLTAFDNDGQVQSVSQVVGGVPTPIASYTYGTHVPPTGTVDVTYGQPLSVTDNISSTAQSFTYASSGGGIGQVASVSESGGGNPSYGTAYTYSAAGDRQTAAYSTPNGTTTWGYYDYISTGDPTSSKRVFQTLTKLNSDGTRSAEEFHYAYDSAGRVRQAAFAQTPTATSRQTNGSYYSSSAQAATRGRVFYGYDPAGRVLSVQHYWDTLSGSTFNSEAILASTGDYELTGMNRGLKLHSYSYVRTSAGSPNWTLANTQTYGYDPALDYLTSTSYTDGLSPSSQTWTYDAAGNRTDTVADNLNRPVTISGVASTSDILGNRLTLGTTTYNWDMLNRMTSLTNPAGTTNYVYRADGMRTFKSSPSSSTLYRYDGQMGIEDVTVTAGATTVTDYALGARGVDGISSTTTSGTTVSYPIYDAHGSMISTLTKNGTGYTYSSVRVFDPWGIIRSGNVAGDPKGRYCANLGHKQDDESGLVYMRARYYEPGSGRFISEDSSKVGSNWFWYCSGNPASKVDNKGFSSDNDYADLVNFAGNVVLEIGVLLMGGFALTKAFAMDFVREYAADKIPSLAGDAGEMAEQALPILKMLSQCMGILGDAAEMSWGGGITKLMGYNMMLMGQTMLTLATCMDPEGENPWWGYGPS